jgi:hypothetical protein
MSVIHCHDDKHFVMLDQELFLRDIYTHTKNWRIAGSSKNFIWRKDLFYIERPFRMTNNAQKKKKKKNTVWWPVYIFRRCNMFCIRNRNIFFIETKLWWSIRWNSKWFNNRSKDLTEWKNNFLFFLIFINSLIKQWIFVKVN